LKHRGLPESTKRENLRFLRLHEQGERIPLTMESSNAERGAISIVVQAVGETTNQLNAFRTDDCILDVAGPLGKLGNSIILGR
jgi:ferredoxin--NADP+ reductase